MHKSYVWALFLNAIQTEIPELCTTKLCRFYEAVPPSPASHELSVLALATSRQGEPLRCNGFV
jgi:hypothetical protein